MYSCREPWDAHVQDRLHTITARPVDKIQVSLRAGKGADHFQVSLQIFYRDTLWRVASGHCHGLSTAWHAAPCVCRTCSDLVSRFPVAHYYRGCPNLGSPTPPNQPAAPLIVGATSARHRHPTTGLPSCPSRLQDSGLRLPCDDEAGSLPPQLNFRTWCGSPSQLPPVPSASRLKCPGTSLRRGRGGPPQRQLVCSNAPPGEPSPAAGASSTGPHSAAGEYLPVVWVAGFAGMVDSPGHHTLRDLRFPATVTEIH